MTKDGRDLLVGAPERWDEACFSVPALRALMASGLSLGIVCRDSQVDFWKTLPGPDVFSFAAKTRASAAAAQVPGPWKAALVWEPGFAADVAKAAKVPQILGPAHPKLRKIVTQTLRFVENPLEHRVRFFLAAVEEMGIHTARPEFFAPASLGIEPIAGTVMVCPDSDFGPSHEWPLDRWLNLAGKLIDSGRKLTIAGLQGGRGTGSALATRLGLEDAFFLASPLAAAMPLLAAHSCLIAADSSLPHLASHAGATCITLFGPNDPAWKRPLGRRHSVIRRHVECAPCLLPKCPLDHRCQMELETDPVISSILRSLP